MERPWLQEELEEIKRLNQNPKTHRLAEFKDRELKDILQREEDAREKGIAREKREVAIRMNADGMPTEEIAKYVRLPIENVMDIIKSLEK